MFCKAYPAHVTKEAAPRQSLGMQLHTLQEWRVKGPDPHVSSLKPHLRGIHNSEVHRNNAKDDIDKEFAYWNSFMSAESWLVKETSQKTDHSKGEEAFHPGPGWS